MNGNHIILQFSHLNSFGEHGRTYTYKDRSFVYYNFIYILSYMPQFDSIYKYIKNEIWIMPFYSKAFTVTLVPITTFCKLN